MNRPQKIMTALGTVLILYGLGVLALIGYSHWFDAAGILAGIGWIGLAQWGPRICASKKPAPRLLAGLLAVAVSGFFLMEGAIVHAALQTPLPGAAYVIIPGAKVNGAVPSLTLDRRIRGAAEYLLDNPDAVAVATGGQGCGEALSEAAGIARELENLGIVPERILLEAESTTTRENLLFALQTIEARGGSGQEPTVIVSSAFHLYRAQRLAAALGYAAVSGKGCPSMGYLEPHYFAREAAALVKEKLDGNL